MITEVLLSWFATTASLYIMSKLPLGIYIEDFGTALVAGLVIGLLNAFLRPVLGVITFPLTLLTLGLFRFALNAILFWTASALVKGFELRGCLAAFVGPVALWLFNSLLFYLISLAG
jgi:putative membrane protein